MHLKPANAIFAFAMLAALPVAAQDNDLSGAIPADQAGKLPSTEEQYKTLKHKVEQVRPGVETAKTKSQALKAEADALRRRLIDTATRVQNLEEEKGRLDIEIVQLSAQEKTMAQSFARDRVKVARLLAILERLQHDMPPVIAFRPDDALGAARGAMLLGASLPRVYGAAAALSRRLEALRQTRATLITRRAESDRNAQQLAAAREELDQLLAMKQQQAEEAALTYGKLQATLDAVADQAADLGQLLARVAALRAGPAAHNIVVVTADTSAAVKGLKRGALLRPVVGPVVDGNSAAAGGISGPGVSFLTSSGAQVVAPADSQVLFAGRYHKTGQVLILEMPGGYDLVLAGLERVDVRPGDQLLAGEPLGNMPAGGSGAKLYFELRQNGKSASPAPWLQIDLRKAKRS
ncbi:MAG TPA: peptidoglycan DD-metalloendopeptidase family protein [Rhizomicrobium sp.]|nr:peptidoglycan DD-metalloendopeptidase family protein [Rhizomicrobium sp.]